MRGGKREGSGRKKGSLTKRTQEIVAAASADGILPLEYMLKILRDENQDAQARFKAACEAAPYLHPKLQSVEHKGDPDNPVHLQTSSVDRPPRENREEWVTRRNAELHKSANGANGANGHHVNGHGLGTAARPAD